LIQIGLKVLDCRDPQISGEDILANSKDGAFLP
jgi:hypothetical protein